MIKFYSDINISDDDRDFILKTLPSHWKTDVKYVLPSEDMELFIKINAKTIDEANAWLTDFQNTTKTTYSVQNTRKCTGEKLTFKKRLNCHHHTRRKETHDPIHRQRVKNTNCPSYIIISMRVTGKRYRGKNQKDAPDPDKPCEIKLKLLHNHPLTEGIGPMFKRVSFEIKNKLISLYKEGHSASTALARIKSDIRLNNENYNEIFADRSQCPDYRYCHYIYERYFAKDSSPVLNEEFLENKLIEYNSRMNEECAKMAISDSGYVICICPPFVKRIHKYSPSARKIVFVHTITICNKIGSKIYVLLTHAEIGAVPLGIILSTSKIQRMNFIGFSLLKEMLGETAFGGNIQGPQYFIIDEHLYEQNILNTLWPQSTILYGMSYVLQNIWKWLSYGKNQISNDYKKKLFADFHDMMYSSLEEEFLIKFEIAQKNATQFPNYLNLINDYLERKHLWAYCFRTKVLISGKCYTETLLRVMKSTDLKWFKSWTIFQLVDFILNNFFQFFEQKLLNTANTGIVECILQEKIQIPPIEILQQIKILSNKVQLVPSEKSNDLIYCVNTDILTCSCFNSISGVMCKHTKWMCLLLHEELFSETIIDIATIKNSFYQILDLPIETNCLKTVNIIDVKNNLFFEDAIIVEVESDVEIENTDDELFAVKNEQLIQEGKQLWNEMTIIFEKFLRKNPTNVVTTTKSLLKNCEGVKTAAQFCSVFRQDVSAENTTKDISTQSTLDNFIIFSDEINYLVTEEPPNKKIK